MTTRKAPHSFEMPKSKRKKGSSFESMISRSLERSLCRFDAELAFWEKEFVTRKPLQIGSKVPPQLKPQKQSDAHEHSLVLEPDFAEVTPLRSCDIQLYRPPYAKEDPVPPRIVNSTIAALGAMEFDSADRQTGILELLGRTFSGDDTTEVYGPGTGGHAFRLRYPVPYAEVGVNYVVPPLSDNDQVLVSATFVVKGTSNIFFLNPPVDHDGGAQTELLIYIRIDSSAGDMLYFKEAEIFRTQIGAGFYMPFISINQPYTFECPVNVPSNATVVIKVGAYLVDLVEVESTLFAAANFSHLSFPNQPPGFIIVKNIKVKHCKDLSVRNPPPR